MQWLIDSSALEMMAQAMKNGLEISEEQQQIFAARFTSEEGSSDSRILTVAGSSAEIKIDGILTNKPSSFAFFFGGGNTTYSEIISAVASAEQNSEVKDITLKVDASPGGTVNGMFEAMEAIRNAKKPITAIVQNEALSATFGIIAQADKIIAANPMTRFGSVGVAIDAFISENEVSVTSSNASKKRPDLATEEGKAIVREQLDSLHQPFVEAIAGGRNTSVEKVNKDFGEGAVLVAAQALKAKMIDRVAKTKLKSTSTKSSKTTTSASGGQQTETINMDLNQLKAEHPAVYQAAVAEAKEIGKTEGAEAERDRVAFHSTMAERTGDTVTAMKAIKDGTSKDDGVTMALYMTANANRQDLNSREEDNANVNDQPTKQELEAKAGDEILAAAAANLGLSLSEAK